MMDIPAKNRKPRNMNVVIANLAAALAEVADEYDQGGMEDGDWHRIRGARSDIESAIERLRPFGSEGVNAG